MKKSINVLLVDDHAVVRAGYRTLLSQTDGVITVIEAESGAEGYQIFAEHQPDMVVMDLSLPGISGLSVIRKMMSRDSNAKILVFSMHDEPVYVTRSIESGAKGYITKSSAPKLLVEAVFRVAQGEIYIEPEIAKRIAVQKLIGDDESVLGHLSPREFEVFSLISRGYTTRQAAEELCLSFKTVANYVTLIKTKLNVNTNSELTRLAYKFKLFNKFDV